MSCDACKDIYEVDEIEPDCIEGECIIPMLDHRGQRIIEIREMLFSLKSIVDAGTILRLYEATREDIDMLAFIERSLQANRPASRSTTDGQTDKP